MAQAKNRVQEWLGKAKVVYLAHQATGDVGFTLRAGRLK
jgi:hypothetical protein